MGDLGQQDDPKQAAMREPPGGDGEMEERHHKALHERLSDLESVVASGAKKGVDVTFVPAWKRLTAGEPRWPVTVAIAVALTLQGLLPEHLVLGPRWLLPSLGGALVIALYATNPRPRLDRTSMFLRTTSLLVIGTISVANGYSAYRLID